jgi:uncharacterized iron-regulated membrane protein
MRDGFRQSMVWLHGWGGLCAGWLLYFIILTGSLAYVHHEITRWMSPELPLQTALPPASDVLAVAEDYLARHSSDAEVWEILFPGHRGVDDLKVGWRPRPGSPKAGSFENVVLDLQTGAPVKRSARVTGGGRALYGMHYALHYMSREVASLIVGAAAMIMFVVILSGVVAYKNILREFFTFRPDQGQQSWRDGHTALAVVVAPFLLTMAWSGLIFSMFTYMPAAQKAIYASDEAFGAFAEEAFQKVAPPPDNRGASAAPLTSLQNVLEQAEAQWGVGRVARLRIENPGRTGARIMVFSQDTSVSGEARLLFDGVTGDALEDATRRTGPGAFYAVMLGVHEAHFARSYLRGLYVLLGLSSAALIATGLVRWSVKRGTHANSDRHVGHTTVAVLNVGVILGLPIAIAAYFWANRILPVNMPMRGTWEVHVMFIAWGLVLLYAVCRPAVRAWPEVCGLAAGAFGLLPVLNALTTDRHLGASVPVGDWGLAGIDLAAFAAGLFFALLARHLWRTRERV